MEEELNDFRQRLEGHLPSLTKSQQRIAAYLLASYDEATFLSAADLAERLNLSQATVVRFAKAIGYDGFPAMRRHLQALFRVKATPAARLQRKLSELAGSQGSVLTKVIDMEVQYLTKAAHSIEPAELRLRRIGVLTIGMTESGRHILEKLQLLRQGDAVLGPGFTTSDLSWSLC